MDYSKRVEGVPAAVAEELEAGIQVCQLFDREEGV
jgi:hypothetical protein